MSAYSQSKLALIMWTRHLMQQHPQGPVLVAVNPGSLLATKMVKEGFGMAGNDINIGADILTRAAIGEEFATASGKYFDNDSGQFGAPHPDVLDPKKCAAVVQAIETLIH